MINFLNKNSIGLDIADNTIEVAELTKKGGRIKIVNLSRIKLVPGIIEKGRIKDEIGLLKAVNQVFTEAKPNPISNKNIIFGLPETQTFTWVSKLKIEDEKQRDGLVFEEAKKNIPLEEIDLIYDYKILKQGKGEEEILIVAASREVVLEWQQFFQKAKLKVKTFDIETLAIFRNLAIETPGQPFCIVDIGAVTTTITIFDEEGLRYSYSIFKAGDFFTQEIAEKLEITFEEAEQKKLKADLAKGDQVSAVLIKSLQSILEEINLSFKYFKIRNQERKGRVILVGGSAQLKGLAEYLSLNLEVDVSIGRPTVKDKKAKLIYLQAIGLALRGIDKRWDQKDPSIPIKQINKSQHTEQLNPKDEPFFQRKTTLFLVIFIAIIIIGFSFWYNKYQDSQLKLAREAALQQYGFNESFQLQVAIVLEGEEYGSDKVIGRILIEEVTMAKDYNQAVSEAKLNAENKLKPGEILWLEPLEKKEENFPFTYKWLAYSGDNAQSLFISLIKEKVKTSFILDNISYQDVATTNNPNIYLLSGKADVSFKNTFQESGQELISNIDIEKIEEKIDYVVIKETSTGWLNMRQGPSTAYTIIKQINVGEKYILLKENKDWVKIKLSEEEEGWVSIQYVEKVR